MPVSGITKGQCIWACGERQAGVCVGVWASYHVGIGHQRRCEWSVVAFDHEASSRYACVHAFGRVAMWGTGCQACGRHEHVWAFEELS
jgi:hypothetical protein